MELDIASPVPGFSADACHMACYWRNPIARNMQMQFQRPWQMTDQARAGLGELVSAEMMTIEKLNNMVNSPVFYKPTEALGELLNQIPANWPPADHHLPVVEADETE